MKHWASEDWCLFILTVTILITVLGLIILKSIGATPLSDNGLAVVKDIINVIGGGLLTALGSKLNKSKTIN